MKVNRRVENKLTDGTGSDPKEKKSQFLITVHLDHDFPSPTASDPMEISQASLPLPAHATSLYFQFARNRDISQHLICHTTPASFHLIGYEIFRNKKIKYWVQFESKYALACHDAEPANKKNAKNLLTLFSQCLPAPGSKGAWTAQPPRSSPPDYPHQHQAQRQHAAA